MTLIVSPSYVAGLDDSGNGCIFGVIAIAAVMLSERNADKLIKAGIRDSKLLKNSAIVDLARLIRSSALAVSIVLVKSSAIHQIGQNRAISAGFKTAVLGLNVRPQSLLIDGLIGCHIQQKQRCIPQGDRKYASIAAASIIARDYHLQLCSVAAQKYPKYDFHINHGYSTPWHLEAIAKYGFLSEHRPGAYTAFRNWNSKLKNDFTGESDGAIGT